MKLLTGFAAIKAAEQDPTIVLCKFADPIEDARYVTLIEAREIAAVDPGLIYAEAK